MRGAVKLLLVSASFIVFPLAVLGAPRHVKVQQLPADTRELYETSMKLSAESFDSTEHLIVRPTRSHSNSRGGFMVRESSWYALGLLARDQSGDRTLAAADSPEMEVVDQFHRDAMRSLRIPVIGTSLDGTVTLWNGGASALWGRCLPFSAAPRRLQDRQKSTRSPPLRHHQSRRRKRTRSVSSMENSASISKSVFV